MAIYPAIVDERAPRLSEALFHFATNLNDTIGNALKERAAQIAASAAASDATKLVQHLLEVKGIVELGARVGEIHKEDAHVILAALEQVSVNAKKTLEETSRPSIAAFSDLIHTTTKSPAKERKETVAVQPAKKERVRASKPTSSLRREVTNLTASKRRKTIVAAINDRPGIGMKNIQEVLPEVSERTLRYDLQQLIKNGAVVREGVGGPATRYMPVAVTSPTS